MRPVLFEFMGRNVPAYGIILVNVFLCGLLIVWRRMKPLGISKHQMLDIAGISAAVILIWVAANLGLAKAKLISTPSLNALPILSIGAFAVLFYLRSQNLPADRSFDAIAPVAAYALSIQYGIGTFLAGTGFGKPTDLPWGIRFPPGSAAFRVNGDVPLHPTQLYLGGLLLIIGLIGDRFGKNMLPGQRSLLTFVALSIAYLAVSPFRGNTTSFLAGGQIRMSETVAVFILGFSLYMYWRRRASQPKPG